jgi:hypothetical protein
MTSTQLSLSPNPTASAEGLEQTLTTSGDDELIVANAAVDPTNMPPRRATSSPVLVVVADSVVVQHGGTTGGGARAESLRDDYPQKSIHRIPRLDRDYHHRRLSCISYEAATWFIFLAITTLAIVDRFTTNVWPRQSFTIGAGNAGFDPLTLIPGPWSVMAYDIIARISGRHAICCFNLLLVTRCKSLEYFLANSTWINVHLLDCSNIVNANIRLHRWNAIALCILTVVHVWSILFPCFFHGYQAQVLVGTFEWPLSERKPKGFKDVNVATETMSLQVDDVWRLVEMTVMLGIFMPLSVRWLARRWHIGMPLHQFIMVLYFVDIVRRHTHPHSILFNTPFFIMWMLDKVFQMYWKRCIQPSVYRIKLDDQYMVVVWNITIDGTSNTILDTNEEANGNTMTTLTAAAAADMVGPDYYLRLNDSSLLEGRHVFTAFENRLGLRLEDMDDNFTKAAAGYNSSTSSGNSGSGGNSMTKQGAAADATSVTTTTTTTWSAATVIRVYDNKRVPRLGDKDPISHTQRMLQQETKTNNQLDLNVWGPVPGEISYHVKNALLAAVASVATSGGGGAASPVVLVGAGSGIGYMLDALQYYYQSGCCSSMESSSLSTTTKRQCHFKILFTTRSPSLFRWVEQMVGKIVHLGECCMPGSDVSNNDLPKNNKNAKIVLALTGTTTTAAKSMADDDDLSQRQRDVEESIVTSSDISPRIMLSQQFGRIDFDDEIPMNSIVFCQGGIDLKNSLQKSCRVKQASWFFGRGGGS